MRVRYLGKQVGRAVSKLDTLPWTGPKDVTITLRSSEITSLCPVTRQPDFGEIELVYRPDSLFVETKSFKLWLRRLRDRRAFNEALAVELARDFMRQVRPTWVRLVLKFAPRGGVSVECYVVLDQFSKEQRDDA